MTYEFETIFKTEHELRVSVDSWDDNGVYLHFIGRHGTFAAIFTHDEAQQLIAGFQKALQIEVTA